MSRHTTSLVIAGICLLIGWAAALNAALAFAGGVPAWVSAFLAVLAIATLIDDAWPLLRGRNVWMP